MAAELQGLTRHEQFLYAIAKGLGADERPEPLTNEELLLADIADKVKEINESGGGSGGTTNYNALSNKPQINGVTVSGSRSSADYGIPSRVITAEELAAMWE